MLTNGFLGDEVARLGFGAMRLPVIDGDNSKVDQDQTDAMVDAAIEAGVNYFDTAYPYHGGMSEIVLGKSLARTRGTASSWLRSFRGTRWPTAMIPPRSSRSS